MAEYHRLLDEKKMGTKIFLVNTLHYICIRY
jgi:hypothetical protein